MDKFRVLLDMSCTENRSFKDDPKGLGVPSGRVMILFSEVRNTGRETESD